jgi:hypothetical protein
MGIECLTITRGTLTTTTTVLRAARTPTRL